MKKSNIIFVSLLSLCLLAIGVVKAISKHRPVLLARPLKTIPLKIDGWQGKEESLGERALKILGVDDYIFRVYQKNGQWVWVYVGYYTRQKKGALVHSPKHCYPGAGWEMLKTEKVKIKLPSKDIIVANKLLLGKDLEKRLVLYWYQERGRIIANEYKAKFYLIYDTIVKRRSNGALVRVSIPVITSPQEAFAVERQFLEVFYPVLKEYLPK